MEYKSKEKTGILKKLSNIIADGEKYWMEKKDDYSSECSISGECGKSMKTFYYNMGQACLDSADDIIKLPVLDKPEENAELSLKLRDIVERTPIPDELKSKVENCIRELESEI